MPIKTDVTEDIIKIKPNRTPMTEGDLIDSIYRTANPQNSNIIDRILKYSLDGFYGKLEISFENGKATHCKETKSIKL